MSKPNRLFTSYKAPWCAGYPVVDPGRTDTQKPITLILPYYENPVFLNDQLKHLATLSAGNLSVIVVDDGSPKYPAKDTYGNGINSTPWLRIFRIEQDIRWNWLAARNIGVKEAQTEWILLTDMDHVLPLPTFISCVWGNHDPKVVYGFSREEHTGQKLAPHPNSWFLTKELFWQIGGYDESFSGYYGTDGEWRRRILQYAPIHILTDKLVRHEYQQDSSTTHYKRKQPQDVAVSRIIKARKPGWKPKVLSFPYTEVTHG